MAGSVQTFDEIRRRAESRWRDILEGTKPYVLVGAATCGRAAGALEVAEAFRAEIARQQLDVPVIEVVTGEDFGVQGTSGSDVSPVTDVIRVGGSASGDAIMTAVVGAARDLARAGDTVLLAPAGASLDQFSGYSHRGDAFGDAVRALSG